MKDAYNVLSVRYYRLSARTTLCLRGISYGPVSVCLSVCLSVCQKPALCRNEWTNQAGYDMEDSFHISHTVL